jgi:hypothetical protein
MILSTRAGSVRQNVHSGVPWTAMLADYQGAHIGGYLRARRRLVLITDCDSVPGAALPSAEQERPAGG